MLNGFIEAPKRHSIACTVNAPLYHVYVYVVHWFIKLNWKTSPLRTLQTMTIRVTVAAVVAVVGLGGNLAQLLFLVSTVKLRSSIRVLNDGYDRIVPPLEWMLHGYSAKSSTLIFGGSLT